MNFGGRFHFGLYNSAFVLSGGREGGKPYQLLDGHQIYSRIQHFPGKGSP